MDGHVRARWALGAVAALAVATVACSADDIDETAGSTSSSSGEAGGPVTLVAPEAGLPELSCPAGTRQIDDGSCQAAGIPPASCGPYFEPLEGGCRAIMPPDPCPAGEMAVPGETSCHPPAECAAGQWGAIPVELDTQYVDDSYTGGDADGSSDKPWPTVQQGVDAAAAGAIVAIAEGSYTQSIVVKDKPVRLWGVCPAKTELIGGAASYTIRVEDADGSEVHDLAITGPAVGFQQHRSTDVVVAGVWVHDLDNLGIDVERSGGDVGITLRDVLVERASRHALFCYGAQVDIERLVVRQTQLNSEGLRGRGIVLVSHEGSGIPTVAQLRRVVSSDQYWYGIDVYGSQALIEDSLVADIEPEPGNGLYGVGISVEQDSVNSLPSEVVIRRVEVVRASHYGLLVNASTVEAEALTVRSSQTVPATPHSGYGVVAHDDATEGANLVLRDVLVEDSTGCGIGAFGSIASVEGAWVRDVAVTAAGWMGRGISGEVNPDTQRRASVTVVGSRVERAAEIGMSAIGADGLFDSVVVLDDANVMASDVSYGILIQQEIATGAAAAGQVRAALVDSVQGVGVGVLGAEATIEATHVRDTRPRPSDGKMGRGMLLQANTQSGATALGTIERCLIEGSGDLGIGVGAATADILHTVVRGTRGNDGLYGDGMTGYAIFTGPAHALELLHPTLMRIASSHVDGTKRAGVSAFGAAVTIEDALVGCSAFALNGEPYHGFDFSFTDEGANRCGCGDDVDTCKVLSEGLSPPTALEQQ